MKKVSTLIILIAFLYTGSFSQEKKSNSKKGTKEITTTIEAGATDTTTVEKTGPGEKVDLKGEWVLVSEINTFNANKFQSSRIQIATIEQIADDPISNGETPAANNSAIQIKDTTEDEKKNFIPEKPSIQFNLMDETINGYTGCNRFTSKFSVEGDKIKFINAEATTKDECKGEYNDSQFFQALRRIAFFRMNNGNIEFLRGDKVIMVFAKEKVKK